MERTATALFCCIILFQAAIANSAMPGMWTPGANGRFMPLFTADSIYFGKIKMQHEQVLVNLYPGFAVVKGEYYMYNTTDAPIHMHVAYPKQARFSDTLVSNVLPSYIAELKVLVNDQPIALIRRKEDAFNKLLEDKRAEDAMASTRSDSYQSSIAVKNQDHENWFMWQMDFKPHAITKITVYFLTDNSHANLRKGYSANKGCGFTYVLESGRAWGGTIDSGKIYIQLNDGLTTKDIKGALPSDSITAYENRLRCSFVNKEPTEKDNILIWYTAVVNDSLFQKKVIPAASQYYAEIDNFNIHAFDNTYFKPLKQVDFTVHSNSHFFDWILIGIAFIAAMVLFLAGYFIVRWIQKSNRKTQRY